MIDMIKSIIDMFAIIFVMQPFSYFVACFVLCMCIGLIHKIMN